MINIEECIDTCRECSTVCLSALFGYCLEQGGEHTTRAHITRMRDCIEICDLAADFMLRGSEHQEMLCKLCARVCDDCAQSCDQFSDKVMKQCAYMCRQCAKSCRSMSAEARKTA